MSEHIFKLPDLGEGTVEAEIVAWHVAPGDAVREGDIVADVMTDKANIEVPSPVTGTVLRTSGEPGDMVAVGAELMALDTAVETRARESERADESKVAASSGGSESAPSASAESAEKATAGSVSTPPAAVATTAPPRVTAPAGGQPQTVTSPAPGPASSIRTSPAVRRRASELGIDLASIPGSGPRGRILMKDLEVRLGGQPPIATPPSGVGEVTEVKVIGVRRVIALRLQAAKQQIPHFGYVEQVDITALESLRRHLNAEYEGPGLTYLPFIALALMKALREFPQCNAHFDSERGVLRQFARVHLGIATQTPDGLKVPVVRNADAYALPQLAEQIRRVTAAARDNTATREELSGSTITLTSLGRLGGIASTPVINAPETSIIGVNKAMDAPVAIDGSIVIRRIMNLSSSFDHRFVDGYDGASLIQAVRKRLEEPATLFIGGAVR